MQNELCLFSRVESKKQARPSQPLNSHQNQQLKVHPAPSVHVLPLLEPSSITQTEWQNSSLNEQKTEKKKD